MNPLPKRLYGQVFVTSIAVFHSPNLPVHEKGPSWGPCNRFVTGSEGGSRDPGIDLILGVSIELAAGLVRASSGDLKALHPVASAVAGDQGIGFLGLAVEETMEHG